MTQFDETSVSEAEGASKKLPASVRQAQILSSFEKTGYVAISELAAEFGVSDMTIRRDLTLLDQRGLLSRTHGGAIAISGALKPAVAFEDEPAFEQRKSDNVEGKAAMARAAAALIGPSESIGLDVGTSTMSLADALNGRRDLRVFTNNLRVLMAMAEAHIPVYTLAGQVRSPEFSVVGPQAVQSLAEHYLDRVFIGVSGIDSGAIYDYSPEDTEVKRAFIEHAGEVVVLCDSSKFGKRALARIVGLDRVDIVITDKAPPQELASVLAAQNVRVIVA